MTNLVYYYALFLKPARWESFKDKQPTLKTTLIVDKVKFHYLLSLYIVLGNSIQVRDLEAETKNINFNPYNAKRLGDRL